MRVKKHALTLLEIVISLVLLGVLLTGLFNVFRQGLKKNIEAKLLKQKVLHLELFQQRLKTLFASESAMWIENYKEAAGPALFFTYEQPVDPDFEMYGKLQGTLFLSRKKELCLLTCVEGGKAVVETLLDNVTSFSCLLFDPKQKQWMENYPKKKTEKPVMLSLQLKANNNEVPFVFFLKSPSEQITYVGAE